MTGKKADHERTVLVADHRGRVDFLVLAQSGKLTHNDPGGHDEDERIERLMPEYEAAVLRGDLESFSAASELIDKYQKKL